MIRLLYPLIVLAYMVGGIIAGPFIGWRCFQEDRRAWENTR